jgi:hypothetical protein
MEDILIVMTGGNLSLSNTITLQYETKFLYLSADSYLSISNAIIQNTMIGELVESSQSDIVINNSLLRNILLTPLYESTYLLSISVESSLTITNSSLNHIQNLFLLMSDSQLSLNEVNLTAINLFKADSYFINAVSSELVITNSHIDDIT